MSRYPLHNEYTNTLSLNLSMTFSKSIGGFEKKAAVRGIEILHGMHTSGHAYEHAIVKLCEAVTPDVVFPIHSENPSRLDELGIKAKIEQFNGNTNTHEI